MPDIRQVEVAFDTYCKLCKYKDILDSEDPCDECLTQFWNENTSKPVNFKPASKTDSVRTRKADRGPHKGK